MTPLLTQKQLPFVKLLMDANIASHPSHAANIIVGLRLDELDTDEARLERAFLYRAWRNSKIYNASAPCYEKAIAGEAVPANDMFDDGLDDSIIGALP